MPQLDLETIIFSTLAEGSPTTDAGTDVFPNEAGQGTEPPYVVFSRIATTPVNALDGYSGISSVRVQFDCYATTKTAAKALAKQVMSLMHQSPAKALPAGEFDDRDPETGLYRSVVDMTCWDKAGGWSAGGQGSLGGQGEAVPAVWGQITGVLADQADLDAALAAKADVGHTHTASEISDSSAAGRAILTAADAAAQRTSLGLGSAATQSAGAFEASGAAAAAVAAHVAAGDPHPGYLTPAEADAAYASLGHGHANATTSTDGYMSAADKVKLDSIAANAAAEAWTWLKLANASVVSTVAFANVSGMSFTAQANTTYLVDVIGAYQTAATTTGIALTLDLPSGSIIGINLVSISATGIGGTEVIADAASTGATTGVRAANTNTPILARFIVAVGGTGGTVQLMQRSEVAASNTTLQAGLTVMGFRAV